MISMGRVISLAPMSLMGVPEELTHPRLVVHFKSIAHSDSRIQFLPPHFQEPAILPGDSILERVMHSLTISQGMILSVNMIKALPHVGKPSPGLIP